MLPLTSRTLNAAVLAAGFAAAGTGAASAAEAEAGASAEANAESSNLPAIKEFEQFKQFGQFKQLNRVPNLDVLLPLNTCWTPGAVTGPQRMPCVDAALDTDAANVINEVGSDVVAMPRSAASQLRDQQSPLAAGEARGLVGSVTGNLGQIKQLTDTRPTIEAEAETQNAGSLDMRSGQSQLLDATIGPRGENHEGTSALDTGLDLTAVEGFTMKPGANITENADKLIANVRDVTGTHADVPMPAKAPRAAKQVPALASLDNLGSARETATGLMDRQLPTETVNDVLPKHLLNVERTLPA